MFFLSRRRRHTRGPRGWSSDVCSSDLSVGWDHESNQTRLGHEKFNDLMWAAYDHGIRFFDLADQYGSMPYFNQAIKKFDRHKIVIQTKSNNRTPDGIRADIQRFLKEIG